MLLNIHSKKKMISYPNLIYYACIAKGTTIVAEFNSKDADLGVIALKCLDKTPSFHTVFSHTVRNRTYLFLIDDPFCYFAIFDEHLEKLQGLAFLKSVKDCFNDMDDSQGTGTGTGTRRRLESMSSHCFQGEFNPVFRQLLASHDEMEGLHSPNSGHKRNGSSDYPRGRSSVPDGKPLLGDAVNCLKKKKKRMILLGDCVKGNGKDGGMNKNRKGSEASDDDMSSRELSREFSVSMQHKNNGGLYSGETGRQKAKKVWRKHVWMVLSMDLIICVILFVVWLCICRGFKCIIDA